MLGVVLLYVGIVLINNGIARITNIDAKSAAVMNVFVGLLSITINIITIVHGDFQAMNDMRRFLFSSYRAIIWIYIFICSCKLYI